MTTEVVSKGPRSQQEETPTSQRDNVSTCKNKGSKQNTSNLFKSNGSIMVCFY